LFFTTALWVYFGIWPAVTVKFRANQIEPGGFLSMGECLVSALDFAQAPSLRLHSGDTGRKLTEHEVAEVAAPGIIIRSDQSPLTFPGGDQ